MASFLTRISTFIFSLVLVGLGLPSPAQEFKSEKIGFQRDSIETFLDRHCYECHDDDVAKGDLNLIDLTFDLKDPSTITQWTSVLDRVESGEMPPKDEPRPAADDLKVFLAKLGQPLIKFDRQRIDLLGRGRVRRLNRSEFETALGDLFSMPLHVQADLPEDAKSHGFDTVGEALNVSSVQMEAYLNVLDDVFDRATTLYSQPKRRKHRLTYREETGIMQVYRKGGPFLIQDDGVAFFATEKFSHLNACLSQFTAPHTARYRVRVSAYAIRSPDEPVILSLRAGGTGHAESNHVPHVWLKHMPVTEGKPRVFEWEGWLERGHYFHVYPTSLRPMRFAGKNEEMRQHEYTGPGAVVQWVEVDGPIYDQWPPASHRVLWGNIQSKPTPGAKPNKDPIEHLDKTPAKTAKPRMTRVPANKQTGNKFIYDPKKQKAGGEPIHRAAPIPGPLHSTRQLVADHPKKDSARLLRAMADRAFRREAREGEIQPVIRLVHHWLDQGRDFESAMRVGYKAIFYFTGFSLSSGKFAGRISLAQPKCPGRAARLFSVEWHARRRTARRGGERQTGRRRRASSADRATAVRPEIRPLSQRVSRLVAGPALDRLHRSRRKTLPGVRPTFAVVDARRDTRFCEKASGRRPACGQRD